MRLILINKPYLVLTAFQSEAGRPTLRGFLHAPGFYPAGRLDHDSEGLLLLTDSGPLQARLTDPKWKVSKTYYVQVEGIPTATALQQLRTGVKLPDGLTRPAVVEVGPEPQWLWPRTPPIRYRKAIPTAWLRLTIQQGRNRQVRRMTAAVGHPTLRLIRWSVGPFTVENLAPGQWREATAEEIAALPIAAKIARHSIRARSRRS